MYSSIQLDNSNIPMWYSKHRSQEVEQSRDLYLRNVSRVDYKVEMTSKRLEWFT